MFFCFGQIFICKCLRYNRYENFKEKKNTLNRLRNSETDSSSTLNSSSIAYKLTVKLRMRYR